MATTNPTRSPSRKASERPGLPLSVTPPRTARKPPAMRATPAHREAPGVLSFRHELGDHERAVIDAAFTILGVYLREPGAVLGSPNAVKDYLRLYLAGEMRELFAVLFLDSQNRPIAIETMFVGTLTQTSVYPREIVLAALGHDAAAVIFAHNHPSGTVQPSRADEALTHNLTVALGFVDVRVMDHVIVGGNQALSMMEKGML